MRFHFTIGVNAKKTLDGYKKKVDLRRCVATFKVHSH